MTVIFPAVATSNECRVRPPRAEAIEGDYMGEGTGVLVIGGGPAGLAAAIAARMKGFDVTVADGAKPPIDKACGEGLMPDALTALDLLGVTIRPDQSAALRGIRFADDSGSVAAS